MGRGYAFPPPAPCLPPPFSEKRAPSLRESKFSSLPSPHFSQSPSSFQLFSLILPPQKWDIGSVKRLTDWWTIIHKLTFGQFYDVFICSASYWYCSMCDSVCHNTDDVLTLFGEGISQWSSFNYVTSGHVRWRHFRSSDITSLPVKWHYVTSGHSNGRVHELPVL